VATKYSMFFNRRYHRVGTIFQGAYKAVMVESEEQLIYLSKYIHRNPLGPTRRSLEGYKYSSYPNYLGLFHQSWVNTEDVLSYFGSKKTNNSYQDFVEETEDKDIATIKSLTLDADE
jgi:putative transposase